MITLECNYSKKLGLPGYSSHQFCITLRTEITDLTQVQAESARLYKLLQEGVDTSIKEPGYLPTNGSSNGNGYGNGIGRSQSNGSNGNGGNGNGNGGQHGNHPSTGPGNGNGGNGEDWNCSPKQKGLILRIVDEGQIDKNHVEGLAQDRFGKHVKTLNKLEASGLIEELLEMSGQNQGNGRGRFQSRFQPRTGAR